MIFRTIKIIKSNNYKQKYFQIKKNKAFHKFKIKGKDILLIISFTLKINLVIKGNQNPLILSFKYKLKIIKIFNKKKNKVLINFLLTFRV